MEVNWFRLSLAQPEAPNNAAPTITNPGSQSHAEGANVNVAIQANDSDGDSLTYSASGLPAQLSINSGTGRIRGTVTRAGNYPVTVAVNDSNGGMATERFDWVVNEPTTTSQYLNPPLMVSDFSKIANVPMSVAALRTAYGVSTVSDPKENIKRIKVVKRNGQHWLQQTFSHDHGDRSFDQHRTGTQFTVDIPGRNHEEIYLSFNMELKSDIVLSRGGKFGPSLKGGPETTTGGNTSNGYNGFSMRNSFVDPQSMSLYVYHPDQPNAAAGEDIHPQINGRLVPWPKGRSVSIQFRVKMNTPERSANAARNHIRSRLAEEFEANPRWTLADREFAAHRMQRRLPESVVPNDGILQVWIDGKLIVDRRDMRWRHDDAIHIDDYFYSAFYGGGSPPFATVKEETVWTTNHAVSNKPLLYNPPR
ncbi:MAG: hypothetical protein COC05_04740 [Gammaproteobacteria bacterium]|nr:MAG: hypothetical protein COC05_04740 [Gammaproteobacteria bacterium]